MVAVERNVQAFAQCGQCADLRKTAHGHQDAEEEEYGAHVDVADEVHDAFLASAFLCRETGIEHFRDDPHQAQHKKNADKRRQMSDGLEDRHEDEAADTYPEHHLALEVAQLLLGSLHGIGHLLALIEISFQPHLQDERGDDHRDDGWYQDLTDDTCCRDQAFVPQHDGRHVTDR